MYIKLNFTVAKSQYTLWRIVTDIINTSAVTNVASLRTRATNASYDSSLLAGLEDATSEIYRTTDLSTTSAHYYGNTGTKQFAMTIQQEDADGTPYYTQLFNTDSGSPNVYYNIGSLITGGTMSSSQMSLSAADNTNTTLGTQLSLAGISLNNTTNYINSSGNGGDNVFTLYVYISDSMFMWATGLGAYAPGGYPASYSASTYSGPWYVGQYTKYDYWNLDTNDMIPVMFTMPDRGTNGQKIAPRNEDFTGVRNPLYTTAANANLSPYGVMSLINASPSIGTTWSKLYAQRICHTVGTISSGQRPLLGNFTITGNATTNSYASFMSNQQFYRFPTANLGAVAFLHMPLGWEMSYYGAMGGNMSDKTGVYIFNGDYAHGDEYTFNDTTYSIWPMSNGFSSRIGHSVPKS